MKAIPNVKRGLAVLLSLAMAISTMGTGYSVNAAETKQAIQTFAVNNSQTVSEIGLKGMGTEQEPYLIENIEDLVVFANYVNSDAGTKTTAYFRQTADIDIGSIPNWTPVGMERNASSSMMSKPLPYEFSGTYDGDGHAIRNMHITGTDHLGFFGYLEGATILDLTVEGSIISEGTAGYLYIGGIAANTNDKAVTISGCTSGVTIQASGSNVGGIVGQTSTDTVIQNCVNEANIKLSLKGDYFSFGTGGIVGYSAGNDTINGCINKAAITSENAAGCTNIGGIAGFTSNGSLLITNSINIGTIRDAGNKLAGGSCGTGGIIGKRTTWFDEAGSDVTGAQPYDTVLTNCYNIGNVGNGNENSIHSGGIIGYALEQDSYERDILNEDNTSQLYTLTGASVYAICADSSLGKELAGQTSLPGTGFFTKTEVPRILAGLGTAFCADSSNINNGYPLLAWQAPGTRQKVSFHITDAESGTAVSSADITVFRDGKELEYDTGLATGQYTYTIAKGNAYEPAAGSFYVGRSEKTVSINIYPKVFTLTLNVKPALAGISLIRESDKEEVELPKPTVSGDTAAYQISLGTSNLYGRYSLGVSAYGYQAYSADMNLTDNQTQNITLQEMPKYNIQINAKDQNGKAVQMKSCLVTSLDYGVDEPENSTGTFQLAPGRYSAFVKATGCGNTKQEFTVENVGKTVTVTMEAHEWDGTTQDVSWYREDASSYTISNGAELAGLAKLVNDGNSFAGKKVFLDEDIELNSKVWTPIGAGGISKAFKGTLDGQGHKITGLALKTASYNQGLFGFLSGATVENLSVTVTDCREYGGSAVMEGYSGAVAYQSSGTVLQEITVEGTLYSNGLIVGALVGEAKSTTFESCINKADVTGLYSIGGMAGVASNNTSFFACANYGTITAVYKYDPNTNVNLGAGGIAGFADTGDVTVESCLNKGNICGTAYLGGIVGTNGSRDTLLISDCYNTGNIDAGGMKADGTAITGFYNGGILGYSSSTNEVKIQNCYSKGSISCTEGNYAGAIAGYLSESAEVGNCYYLQAGSLAGISGQSDAKGKTESFTSPDGLEETLGIAYIKEFDGTNNGYPQLSWENGDTTYTVDFQVTYDTEANRDDSKKITYKIGDETAASTTSLKKGHYTYSVELDGYETAAGSFSVNGKNKTVNVELKANKYTCTFTGIPKNASFTLTDSNGQEAAYTDKVEQGDTVTISYELYNGRYTYTAKAFGYQICSAGTTVSFKNSTTAVAMTALPTKTVSVTVTDGANKIPEYTFELYSTEEGYDGELLASYKNNTSNLALPVGSYRYVVRAIGYEKSEGNFTLSGSDDGWTANIPLTAKTGGNWDGETIDTEWYEENKESSEFWIYTEAELAGLAKLVNSGTSFSGKTITLMSDLVLSNTQWTPIGNYAYPTLPFSGVFDGNGKIINCQNLELKLAGRTAGLFGYIEKAEIKDLILTGDLFADITAGTSDYAIYAGVLAGYAGKSTISRCANRADFSAVFRKDSGYVSVDMGGICGASGGSVLDSCNNISHIQAQSESDMISMNIGGVCGYHDSVNTKNSITGCYHAGIVTGNGVGTVNAGGIAGRYYSDSYSVLDKCYSAGKVEVKGENTESGPLVGIAAFPSGKTIEDYPLGENLYFLTTLSADPSSEYGTAKTAKEMGTAAFAQLLGGQFKANDNAYPLNSWESKVSKIEIETQPEKTAYNDLEDFDTTGLTIRVHYTEEDEGIVIHSGYMVVDGESLKASQTSVTINYMGKEVVIPITVTQVEHTADNSLLKFAVTPPTPGSTVTSTVPLTERQQAAIEEIRLAWNSGGEAVTKFEANRYYRAQVTVKSRYKDGDVWYLFADDAAEKTEFEGIYDITGATLSADKKTLSFTITFNPSETVTPEASHLYYKGVEGKEDISAALEKTLEVSVAEDTANEPAETVTYTLEELESMALGTFGAEAKYSQYGEESGRTSALYTGLRLYQLLQQSGVSDLASNESKVTVNGEHEYTLGELRATGSSFDADGKKLADKLPYLLAYGKDKTPNPSASPLTLAAPAVSSDEKNSGKFVENVQTIDVVTTPAETYTVTFEPEQEADVELSIWDSYGNLVHQDAFDGEESMDVVLRQGETYHYEAAALGCVTQKGVVFEESFVLIRIIRQWNGEYTKPETDSEGYYLISTPEELAWYNRQATSVDRNTADEMAAANIRLTADLSMEGYRWKVIAGTEYSSTVSTSGGGYYSGGSYTGTFDGQGHTIYGLHIDRYNTYIDTESGESVLPYSNRVDAVGGLFGYANGATIKNVGLEGDILIGDAPTGIANMLQVGGLVGFAQSETVIEGCYTDMDITMKVFTYTNSSGDLVIRGTPEESDTYIGGIAGSLTRASTVENCYTKGIYYGEGTRTVNIGGISGSTRNGDNSIKKCYSEAQIFSNPELYAESGLVSYIGGIVGKVNALSSEYKAEVAYCFALNDILDGADAQYLEAGRIVGNSGRFDIGGEYNFALDTMSIQNASESPYDEEDSGYRTSRGRDITKEAACTETAYTNVLWSEDIWNFEIAESYPIFVWQPAPVSAHEHDYETTVIEATCTKAGYSYSECSICHKKKYSDPTPALGHDYQLHIIKEADCIEDGEGEYVCSRCGDSYTETIPHGHIWNENYTVDKAATCLEDGSESIHCKNCNAVKEGTSRPIKALGHHYKATVTAPTYEAKGYTTYTCTRCQHSYTAEETAIKTLAAPAVSTVKNTAKGIKITWKKVSGAKGYYIYQKTGSSKTWKKIKTITSGSTCSYQNKSVKNGTVYTYAVEAFNGKNVSARSKTKSCIRLKPVAKLKLKALSGGRLQVKYSKNKKAGGYQIQYSTAKSFKGAKNKSVSKKKLVITLKKLKKNKKYYVRVRAYKKSGKTRYYSSWVSKSIRTAKK